MSKASLDGRVPLFTTPDRVLFGGDFPPPLRFCPLPPTRLVSVFPSLRSGPSLLQPAGFTFFFSVSSPQPSNQGRDVVISFLNSTPFIHPLAARAPSGPQVAVHHGGTSFSEAAPVFFSLFPFPQGCRFPGLPERTRFFNFFFFLSPSTVGILLFLPKLWFLVDLPPSGSFPTRLVLSLSPLFFSPSCWWFKRLRTLVAAADFFLLCDC